MMKQFFVIVCFRDFGGKADVQYNQNSAKNDVKSARKYLGTFCPAQLHHA